MNLRLWKRGCAALLAGIMVWTQPLCVLAETGGSVEAAAESDEENASEEQQETVETASASDASGDESENESGSGILTQQVVFDDAVELINDLAVESAEEDELASDSDADGIELINDLEYDLASDADADQVELTNDLLVEEADPEWMTEEMSYTFEWGDLVDGIPEIDFSDYILDGEIDGNAGIALMSLDSDSDSGDYWSEQIDEDALDYYELLVDYYDAVIGGSGSTDETCDLGEINSFEQEEDITEVASNDLDGLKYYVYQAIYAFRYNYPMMFWEPTITCNVSCSGYADSDGLYTGTTTGSITITCDLSDSEVYDMVDEITGVVDSFDLSGDTDYAVLKSVHDQICEIADYDDTLAADYAHSAYGALVLGVSVCEGYAKAFKVFCDELGIPCVLIVGLGGSGSSYGSHMWNYVQMDDGLWYGVDVTWDDQDSGILDACFLVGSNTLDTFADTFGNMHIEEPLTIVAGDSTVYLYYPAIAEERYVESEVDTTEIVSIPDENLKAALLETGDTNGDGEMSVAEMETITYFHAVGRGIVDLTGLEYAVNIVDLDLGSNQVTEIGALSGMIYMMQLGLAENQITDISALSGMSDLTLLWLWENEIEDISPLSGLTELYDLRLQGNQITDISSLQELAQLQYLDISSNNLTTVPDLTALTELSLYEEDGSPRKMFYSNQILRDEFTGKFAENIEVTEEWLDLNSYDATIVEIPDASLKAALLAAGDTDGDGEMSITEMSYLYYFGDEWNGIVDLTGLEYAVNLIYLGLNNNEIIDISPLSGLTNLDALELSNNQIEDLSPLSGLTNLDAISLSDNPITDFSPLENLTQLTSLSLENIDISDIDGVIANMTKMVTLNVINTQISDIGFLSGMTDLVYLQASNNRIEDISVLSKLTNLEQLSLGNNEISDISPIRNLTQLDTLYIDNNNITDLSSIEIQNMTRLSTLYAGYNELTTVPDMTALTELTLYYDDGSPRDMFTGNQIPRDEFTGKFADNVEVTEEWLDVNSYDGTIVDIPDEVLKAMLLEAGDSDGDGEMNATEMMSLAFFDAGWCGITDLTGLEYATYLDKLDVSGNQLQDLTPISGLPKLATLYLNDCGLTDISALENLTQMDTLEINDNQITDISAIGNMTQLGWLHASNNQITDLESISGLSYLNNLEINGNQITDLSPISKLENMFHLNIGNNQITDISAIQNLTGLDGFYASNNELTTLPDLTALTELKLYDDGNPREMFTGNSIVRDEFTGKFADNIEVTEEWLDLNSYDPETVAIVEIPDEALKALIVESYDTNGDGEMSVGEMRQITSLMNRSYSGITDLTGLEYATNLTDLTLNNYWWYSYAGISDLTPLSGLTSLTSLGLYRNDVTDISPLSGLTNLVSLNLQENQVADISALAELTDLRYLYVTESGISDISVLAGLDSLENLSLEGNEINDISALSGLKNLEMLLLYENNITDVTPLANLTNLYELDLDGNAIEDIEGLSGLTDMESLSLNDNDITDLSPIQNMTNLQELYIRNNKLTEMPYLTELTSLSLYEEYEWDDEVSSEPRNMFSGNQIPEEEFAGKFADGIELTEEWLALNSYDGTEVYIPDDALREALLAEYDLDSDGVMVASEMRIIDYLELTNLGIQDLTGLEYATGLIDLDLSYNEIVDVMPLGGLTGLEMLTLSNNEISDITALAGLNGLYTLKMSDNLVSDLSPIASMTSLEGLRLNNNLISDISPLAGLHLDMLHLNNNQISDLSPLEGYDWFSYLYLSGNQISDISPLAGLEGVDNLNLSNNQISDISALAGMSDISMLLLNDNEITDISALADAEIRFDLELDDNNITDLSPIQNQTDLQWMTVTNNQLTTVPDLTALTNLSLYEDDTPINMFGGNQIPRDEFTGKFADGIELTEEWLDLNSYVSSGETPVITTQPESAVGEIGDTITFAVEADGAASYIWYYSADDGESWKLLKTWEGYDTDTLSFELTSNRLNYLYHCVLTGSDGSTVTTDDVCVQETGLTIVTQPVSVTASIGDTVTYAVEALKAVSYNWYYSADEGESWSILKSWDGYNTAELSFELTSNRLNYRYHCVVKGSDGTTLTTDDVYVEEQGFAILEQPENAVGEIGDTITFTTKAAKAVSYNWYYSTDSGETWKLLKEWDGYDTNTLSFELTSLRLSYLYHCVVKGSDGTTLTTDDVYVEEQEFAILTQPESVTASIGDTVTFVTEAAKAVSYNWYYSADSGESWKLLKSWDGYDTNTLSFEVTGNRLNYLYHCVVKGSDGTTLTTDAVSIESK